MNKLSPTETAIIRLLAQGYTTPQIARIRDRARSTIETETQSIRAKLHAHNQTEAVAIWMGAGGHLEPLEGTVRVLGTIGSPARLSPDGVTLLESPVGVIAQCFECAVTIPIRMAKDLIAFDDEHGDHLKEEMAS